MNISCLRSQTVRIPYGYFSIFVRLWLHSIQISLKKCDGWLQRWVEPRDSEWVFPQRSAQVSLKRTMGWGSNTIPCTLNSEQMDNWPYCVNQWRFQNLFKDIYMIKFLDSIDSIKGWMLQFAPRASCRNLFELKSSRGHWKRSARGNVSNG